MTLDEIEAMSVGRGQSHTRQQVNDWLRRHGEIVPEWYADLWTYRAIFETNLWVYEKDETDPFDQLSSLVLKGPGDWRDEQARMWDRQYFSLGLWQGDAHWLIARVKSRGREASIWTIDHEYADNLNEVMAIDGIKTFKQLLNRVVNWPILRAVDRWRDLADRKSNATDDTESAQKTESGSAQAVREKQIELECGGFRCRHVTRALAGDYLVPAELDEFERELPEELRRTILTEKQTSKRRLDAAGIGPLPHYDEAEIPAALRYVWEWLEWYPLGPWKLHRGVSLLSAMSRAFQQGITHHLFVISAAQDQYITMDMKRAVAFDECPIVSWPSGEELAPSLGEWLLGQLADDGNQ